MLCKSVHVLLVVASTYIWKLTHPGRFFAEQLWGTMEGASRSCRGAEVSSRDLVGKDGPGTCRPQCWFWIQGAFFWKEASFLSPGGGTGLEVDKRGPDIPQAEDTASPTGLCGHPRPLYSGRSWVHSGAPQICPLLVGTCTKQCPDRNRRPEVDLRGSRWGEK